MNELDPSLRDEKGKIIVIRPQDPANLVQLGPYGIETLISPEEENRATAYRVRIGANQKTATSYHSIAEEIYFVLLGEGWVWLNGVREKLTPGVFLRLPPGTRHAFVAGPQGLEMLDIHTPGCRPDKDVYFEDGPPPEGFKSC